MRTWDAETLARFLEAERPSRYQVAWLLPGHDGLPARRSTRSSLGRRRLRLGRASLRHTITAIDHRIHAKPDTKVPRKPRVIDLDAESVAAMRYWRTKQAEERLLLGPAYDDRGLVFDVLYEGRRSRAWSPKRALPDAAPAHLAPTSPVISR